MQLSELIQRLSKLHDIHGDLVVLDDTEDHVVGASFRASGEFTDAPYIEVSVYGEEE